MDRNNESHNNSRFEPNTDRIQGRKVNDGINRQSNILSSAAKNIFA